MPLTARFLRYFYFAYLARPKSDRTLFRAAHRARARRILEIGVGDCRRGRRLIDLARLATRDAAVAYTGIDLFEARPSNDGLPLREAYRQLVARGARVRLVPGEIHEALAAAINSGLGKQDFILVSADHDVESLDRAWHLLARLVHDRTVVFIERAADGNRPTLRLVTQDELRPKPAIVSRRRAA